MQTCYYYSWALFVDSGYILDFRKHMILYLLSETHYTLEQFIHRDSNTGLKNAVTFTG